LFAGWDYDFGFKALPSEENPEIPRYISRVSIAVYAIVDSLSLLAPDGAQAPAVHLTPSPLFHSRTSLA